MRKAVDIGRLYMDFDGFFASVMQQVMPELRNKPVGVVPFEVSKADSTFVIACSKEAKKAGCKNVMPVPEARKICPDIVLVMQRPDLFRRAHNALLNEVSCEIPIETVKSIDELVCILDKKAITDPLGLAERIKKRLRKNVGEQITCSIGFAANRLLAKMASKRNKPDGITIWLPSLMPEPLFLLSLSDIPGIAKKIERRLNISGIYSVRDLYNSQPKHLRAIWHNVTGERMWYALHGYDIHAMTTKRAMYGHGRVLPPDWRDIEHAQSCSRLLLTKAALRMRRDGHYASTLQLWLDMRDGWWSGKRELCSVQDDFAILAELDSLWITALQELDSRATIVRLFVTLADLSPASERQLDLFLDDDKQRRKYEAITHIIDYINRKFGQRAITIGPWTAPPGGYLGGKIAYNRIPSAEDFW